MLQGCWYHGCECLKRHEEHLYRGHDQRLPLGLNERRDQTVFKLNTLKNLGYNLIVETECNFKEFLKSNKCIDDELSFSAQLMFPKLNPRDSVFGGRTEVFKLYHKVTGHQKIRYIDFTSLYPFVNWRCKYPVGHPTKIYKGMDCDNLEISDDHEGFILCRILAPRSMYIPILPYRANNKLLFPLCAACANKTQTRPCNHNEDERTMYGTWPLCEVKLALKHGYDMIQIIEMWTYDTAQYDPETRTGGLFTEYMKTFLKIKQEASGWPSYCHKGNDDEKEILRSKYLERILETDGIQLEYDKINVNPSYRNLGKLFLNSLWGKLTQRDNLKQTDVIRDVYELHDLLYSPLVEVSDIFFPNIHTAWVCWQFKEDVIPLMKSSSKNLSLTTGSYTTAHARALLFDQLIQLNAKLLYTDTDSIIYIEEPGMKYSPDIGPSIGQLTNELSEFGPDAYIDEFVSVGPKSYSIRIKNGVSDRTIEISKCKGFQSKEGNVLCFDAFKKMIEDDHVVETRISNIQRRKHFQIVTDELKKKFGFTFDKRVCFSDHSTLPFGHEDILDF